MSDWVADDEDTLSELLTRLRQTWQNSGEISELARVYGRDGDGDGAGARDPRTAAQHPRLKDVLKGDLTPFLDACAGCRESGNDGDNPHWAARALADLHGKSNDPEPLLGKLVHARNVL